MKYGPNGEFSESSCSCDRCRAMCEAPCIPTPQEAERLIQLGYGPKLMQRPIYNWEIHDDIQVLCPANPGKEGQVVNIVFRDGCVFQDASGLCQLHDLGLKPLEGRLAIHGMSNNGLHDFVASTWDSYDGERVNSLWKEGEEK